MKKMDKETVKTISLIILIFSALILFAQVLLLDVLSYDRSVGLPDLWDKAFISYNVPSFDNDTADNENMNREGKIFVPSCVLAQINELEYGSVARTSQELLNTSDYLHGFLSSAFSEEFLGSIVRTGKEKWENGVARGTLFIDYGKVIPIDVFSEYINLKPNISDYIKGVRYISVVKENSDIDIYMKNSENGDIVVVNSKTLSNLETLFVKWQGTPICKFMPYAMAVRLGIILETEDTNFKPESVIPLDKFKTRTIMVQNPAQAYKTENVIFGSEIKQILKAFGYDANSVHKYTSGDGSIMYVEDYNTLNLGASGVIKYSVSKDNMGIPLSDLTVKKSGELTALDLIMGGKALLSDISSNILGGYDATVSFGGIKYFADKDFYRVYFKYMCDGYDIFPAIPTDDEGYPISIDMKNGYITAATIYSRIYSANGEVSQPAPNSLLKLFLTNAKGIINDVSLCYVDNGFNHVMLNSGWRIYQTEKQGE